MGRSRILGDLAHPWARGPENNSTRGRLIYTARPIDVETSLDATLGWQADVTGEAVMEYRAADTIGALRTVPWAAHEPARTVRGRFFQARWTVTSTDEDLATLDHLCWSVNAPAATTPSARPRHRGLGRFGRTMAVSSPHDLILVTDLSVTLQTVGPGWTWDLATKNNPTRLRIFDGQGNPADATIDVARARHNTAARHRQAGDTREHPSHAGCPVRRGRLGRRGARNII